MLDSDFGNFPMYKFHFMEPCTLGQMKDSVLNMLKNKNPSCVVRVFYERLKARSTMAFFTIDRNDELEFAINRIIHDLDVFIEKNKDYS